MRTKDLFGIVGVAQGVHRHCHRADLAGLRDHAHPHLTLGVGRDQGLVAEGLQVGDEDAVLERADVDDGILVRTGEVVVVMEQLVGRGQDHRVRVPQNLPVDPNLTHCGNLPVLHRRVGIHNDVNIRRQPQVEHGRLGVEPPLVGDELLELRTINGDVGERFVVGLDVERLPVGHQAVLVRARDVVVAAGLEVGEVLLHVPGTDDADIVAGTRRFDGGDPAVVRVGDQVGGRGLRCRIGAGDSSVRPTQEVRPNMRQRLLGDLPGGPLILPGLAPHLRRGSSACVMSDPHVLRAGGDDLPSRSVVLQENVPEAPAVDLGLDDSDRVSLESGDDLSVLPCPTAGDDGVDVPGEARRRGSHVLVAEHDDDVSLTIGRVAVLELGGASIGRGHRRGDAQNLSVRSECSDGKLVGHHTDEADAHPVDFLNEDPASAPLGTEGSGAGHVRRQDGEVGGWQDPVLEVLHSAIERVDPQG